MTWHIVCDFDGTIAETDVTDSLLSRFADPAWEAVEAAWKAGRIGARECMARQVAMIRATQMDLDSHLDGIAIDPGFPAFAGLARRLGIPLTVVSDGIDYAIHRILRRHRLDGLPVLANRLEPEGDDGWRLSFPHATAACTSRAGTCKCHHAERGHPGRLTLVIGDGASDRCVAAAADFVFAKASLVDFCRERGLPHQVFADFDEAARLLPALVAAVPVERLSSSVLISR